ncbi:actin cytoskeleton organization protein App1 [Pochonia chlamydosporia 170]|uniref:Actin cytoskeleton organization protein App1 n=1 Tax=Pochonia chlamydosporia 170 TaxID=1380566 RepID=A0A179F6S7_METCM|nr:actin cytoskeleton organization protein App1 [Pochonia chlamydosporia 170]OAQ61165.1 actin cytoskeleton organization protein App1 [Pochonia chlamydosporia 170]
MPSYAGLTASGYGPGPSDTSQDVGERGERGYRRRKLAAMAGNLYRSGQQAVTDLRDSYVQSRGRGFDDFGTDQSTHIPGAFPDVAITSQGNEQMVLFPSYAKRHIKRDWTRVPRNQPTDQSEVQNEDWWRQEWEKHEDEKAVVDVDIRGWIYSPHVGPMTRRNRILIGLARQLSGIPAPKEDQGPGPSASGELKTQHQIHDEIHDQEKIAREAAMIEKRGQQEKHVARAGGYSEQPSDGNTLGVESARFRRRGSYTPESAPSSPSLSARQPSGLGELTDAELAIANANLMGRVAPFLTNPMVAMPMTIFFYNETRSQSKTVLTDDAGHFNVRAALEFIPTHVRVLANEKLSATQEVKITEPAGVSLISDIDDTVKRSNISAGAREIFRNTFVRNLGDMTIEGVREWYTDMHKLGVSMHYCSNSPWQLFPVLASFFKIAGLPPGSLHLKQYSGMLQGIFEPVAERKKSTLNRLVKDFPNRKFLLVGDSGEADLEVYTELALANPGRILAIFIRDVTTPEMTGYFDPAFDYNQRKMSSMTLDDGRPGSVKSTSRQNSAPGTAAEAKAASGPVMGTLIDFSDEPEEMTLDESAALAQVKQANPARRPSATDLLGARKPPPPRPAKPAALRSAPAHANVSNVTAKADMPPPKPKRPQGLGLSGLTPLTTIPSAGQEGVQNTKSSSTPASPEQNPAPPPLPRRRSGLKSLSPRLFGRGGSSSNADVDFEPLPPSAAAPPPPPSFGFSYYRSGSRSGSTTPSGSPTLGAQGVNKKLELWRRRLARAHEQLDSQGVALYTWRTGHDVVAEAVGIVKSAREEMKRKKWR